MTRATTTQKKRRKRYFAFGALHFWHRYKFFVERATQRSKKVGGQNENYWRDKLFTTFITWLIPVCVIALIPGVIMGFKEGYPFIAEFDLFSAGAIVVIALNSRINLTFRKFFVFFMIYCLATMLLVYLGLLGPGLLYLLALSVLIALTYPLNIAIFSILGNLFICACCGFVIYFKVFNTPLVKEFNLSVWVAVSSNLIFLSLVGVMLITNTIKRLENTIATEFKLKNRLQQEILERHRSNLLLKESEGHYKSLFSKGPSPMWVLDNETLRFLQVNETAVTTYGYTNEEFLNMTVEEIKLEEDVPGFFELLQESNRTGTSLININQHRRKNGETFMVELVFNPIPFEGKEATLVIARDMTQQMNYINAIEDQNEKLYEISYIQSHIVRAPLARIMGLVSLITSNAEVKPDPEVLTHLTESTQEFDEVIKTIIRKTEKI
jgi:PAS domain S-box-containing protein